MTVYPAIEAFVDDFLRMGLKNRTLSLIENGSWRRRQIDSCGKS